MTPMPRTHVLLRLTFGVGAVLSTTLIGLSIHALAHHYDDAAEALAAAKPVVVAQVPAR